MYVYNWFDYCSYCCNYGSDWLKLHSPVIVVNSGHGALSHAPWVRTHARMAGVAVELVKKQFKLLLLLLLLMNVNCSLLLPWKETGSGNGAKKKDTTIWRYSRLISRETHLLRLRLLPGERSGAVDSNTGTWGWQLLLE